MWSVKALNKKYANGTKDGINFYFDLFQTFHKKNSPQKEASS